MRGISGLVIVLVVIFFSGAGSWMWKYIKQIDTECYSALYRVGRISDPICDAVSHGIGSIEAGLDGVSQKFLIWKQSTFGGTVNLGSMTSELGEHLTQFASSNDILNHMMQAGPNNFGGSTRSSIQQAIDSFTIGQGYMNQNADGSSTRALEWFQRGAQQPQGYGVMSQLALGSLYLNGQGVPQSNQTASLYLQQASNSLTMLMGNNTPQSQQILNSLPGSPQQVKAQLDTAIRQLRAVK